MRVAFITGNPNKVREVEAILGELGVPVEVEAVDLRLKERQLDSVEEVALEAAREAYEVLRRPLMVEDAGLFIDALNGFPGPYSAYVYRTIGNEGVLKLMWGVEDRGATFKAAIAYCEPTGEVKLFVGEVRGYIAHEARGAGWGFDPIFIPEGVGDRTYAELGPLKNRVSHRRRALEKLASYLKGRASWE